MSGRWPKALTVLFAVLLSTAGCGSPPPSAPAGRAPSGQAASTFQATGEIALVQKGNLFLLSLPDGRLHRLTAAGGVSEPGFSPDGRWISFLDDNHLWLVRSDGGGLHEIQGLPVPVYANTWSPVADRLAVRGDNAIWLVPLEGMAKTVQGAPKDIEGFAWSPDGRQVAVVAPVPGSGANGPPDDALYVGTWQGNALTGTRQRYVSHSNGIILAGWPPGGLLFWIDPLHGAELASYGMHLEDMDAQSGRVRDLGVTPGFPEWIVSAPPDTIDFVRGGGYSDMVNRRPAVADLATGKVNDLTLPAGSVYLSPALAPGQDQLAFVVGPSAPGESQGVSVAQRDSDTWKQELSLGVAGTDGTGFHVLAGAGKGVGSPIFTSDGRHIIYERANAL